TADFNGTPLVVPDNDSVLVVARGGKGNQFEDGYVVCLSLSGGQYKWSTYVGSASHMFDMGDNGVEQLGTSEMCLAEGRVFVLTNLGTVAALDPYDGRMIWLSAYPRDVTDNPEQMQMVFRNRMANGGRAGTNKPWANNPVIVANGKVFVLPTDGRHLLVYDAGTGAEANRILLSDYDNADVLLGVRPRMAILSTEKGCYCIDWRAYTHDDAEHAIIWARKDVAADTVAGEENTIFGRGFVTSDSVFLPTRHRLYQLGWFKGGKVMSMYPSRGQWSGDEEPGNVLATSQGVIIAGSTRVEVYRDLTLVRRQFEERIAASPNDPQPRIDYASALFASGQLDAAVAKLDEAIEMIGGQSAMRPGKGRDLVFTTALSFAERAAKDPANETGSVTEKLYDRAAAAADSPLDQAVYRLSRARHLHDRKDYAGEVKLCQEVLSDDAMRAVSVNDNTTAGAEAEAAVNGAMLADRTAYAPIEQAAAAAVKAASAADDPSQMLAVARVYPNSRAAAEARQAAAKLLEAAKRYDEAIATLREMYAGSLDPAVRTNLLVSVANDYLTMPGGVGPAIDRLAMATAKDQVQDRMPQALILPDGTRIENATFTAAIGTLREMQEKEDVARLPDFHIPVQVHAKDKAFTRTEGSLVIPDVTALVRPLRDFPRNDRVVAWSATAGLSIYPVGESTPVTTMPASALPESPGGCAWIDPAKLVLWSGSRVMLLGDGAGAGPKWQTPLPSGPALSTTVADSRGAIDDEQVAMDQAAGNAGAAGPNGIVIDGGFGGGGRIIVRNGRQFIINGGQIRFIAQGNIGIAGQPAAAPAPAGAAAVGLGPQITMFRPAGDRIVLSTSLGTLMGLKVNDGGIAWQMRLAEGPLTQVLANGRFTVARIDDPAGAQLIVLDTPTGRVIGRRRFGPDGTGNQLMNVALSEEATLVWTTLAKLLSKDLYEPWRNPPVDLSTRPTGEAMNFAGLNQPDQLLVRAGRVVALYDGGKFVRVQDLSNRRIDPVTPAANPLATGADTTAGSASVALRLVGPRLFITNGRNLWQYNLASADDHYKTLLFDLDYPPRIRELFLGQDHAILLNEPVDRGPLGSSFVQLLIHRRGPIGPGNAREASNLDYYPQITDKSGIFAWQAVDGGMYYLSGDHQLHFLQARK
ncbi:MAG TPA: PQQ-binding-like beta-propeller repeat protein, partial [Tepidisphaeraceae bacterium]|nr:PQQ-binding-like beta-propeller repeat protein [Tepidisphaeraceae bacterium]